MALLGEIGRQTTEDLEVEVLTASFKEMLPLYEPVPSDSSGMPSPVNEFRSISNNELGKPLLANEPVKPLLAKLMSEEIIQSDSEEEEKVESKPFKKPDKPRPKARDLWKKAGFKARSSVSDKGWAGVLNKAKAEGKLAPGILNMNITNALTKMAKTQEKVKKVSENNDQKEVITVSKANEPENGPTHPEKRRKNSSSKIPKPTSNWAKLRSHSAFAKKDPKPVAVPATQTTAITDVTNDQKKVKAAIASSVISPTPTRKISGASGPDNHRKKSTSENSQATSKSVPKPVSKPGTPLKKRKSETALSEKTVTPSARRMSAAPALSPVKRSSASSTPSTPSSRRKSEAPITPSTPSSRRKSEAPITPAAKRRSSTSAAPLTKAKTVTTGKLINLLSPFYLKCFNF